MDKIKLKKEMLEEAALLIESVEFLYKESDKALARLDIEENKENLDYEKIEQLVKEVESFLAKCVQEHKNIDRFVEKYNKFYESNDFKALKKSLKR